MGAIYLHDNNGTVNITGYTGPGGDVTIPSSINGLPVTSIGNGAFFNCMSLNSVTIPNSVTNIGVNVFGGCANLTGITVNTNNSAFTSMAGVLFNKSQTMLVQYPGKAGSYTIPNGITSIGDYAFGYSSSLTSVTIPNSVTNIAGYAFEFCTNLNGIYFQGNAPGADSTIFGGDNSATVYYWPGTTGWSSTFAGRPALSLNPFNYTINNGTITITRYIGFGGAISIAIPSTLNNLPVTTIGQDAFESINMTSVTIPDSVTIIGDAALGGCTNLTSIIIPNSVTSIGYAALDSCTSLASVTIGSGVTNIGVFAFDHCTSLKSITVDPLNSVYSSLDGVLFDKSQATLIQCPPSGAAGNYTIPNSVTNIGPVSFAYCASLTSVTIPNNITGIGSDAFYSCIRMTSVYFSGNAINVDSTVFSGDSNVTIYYLSGTTGWGSTFGGFPTALWKPQVQTGDSSFGVRTNQFGFNINWASGMVVVVEACTNFSNPVWQPVKTNTIAGSSSYFSDSKWTNYHARFYRLRSP